MINSKNVKALLALLFAIISTVLCCIPAYAAPKLERDIAYFDYSDGIVRDGDRNDRPGIIGDELADDWKERSSDDMSRNARANDSDTAVTFWGIVVALLVATSVILLIALVVPKSKNRGN